MALINDLLEFFYEIQRGKSWHNGECEVFNPELKAKDVMKLMRRVSEEPFNKSNTTNSNN